MTALQKSVLIVEDEYLISLGLSAQIQDMGLDVCATADSAEAAVAQARMHRPAIVLMDVRLRGEQDGVDAALAIYDSVGSKIIFITGSREQKTIDRINQDHPFATMFKPISDRQLQATVNQAMQAAGHA
ncbi:MAG TPA: response regulator [Rhizomicrobium sp.]|nr:response regulator [Rhizomicrobium sp.]